MLRSSEQALANPDSASPNRRRPRARPADAHYAAGLAHAGLGDTAKARASFQQALAIDPAHVGARTALTALN